MDIQQQLSRIKKGMALVDSGLDKNGSPLDEKGMEKHIELLRKLMYDLTVYGHANNIDWDKELKTF